MFIFSVKECLKILWNERPPGIFRIELIIKLYEDEDNDVEQIKLFPYPPSWYKPAFLKL